MRKYIFVITLTIVLILAVIGGGFTYWLGKQPKVIHYQNGQIKTITPRDFFKEVGEAKFYDENGKLIQKYNVVNGIKEGRSVVYFNEGEIEFDYVDGKISGKVNIETDDDISEFQNLSIKATEGTFHIKKKRENESISSLASITCDDEQFVSVLKNYADKRDKDSLTELLRCVKLENIKNGDKCSIDGSFEYPSFSEGTKISCENTELNISGDTYRFNINNGYGQSAVNAEISVKKVCSDEKIVDFFISQSDNKKKIPELSSIKDFLGCFNFEKVKFKNDEVQCAFQGGFKYPSFTQNSRLICETDTRFFEELSLLPDDSRKILTSFLGEVMDAKKVKYTVDYLVKDGTIVFNTKTDNQSLDSTVTTSGWDKIIPETLNIASKAAERAVAAYVGDFEDLDVSDIKHNDALEDSIKLLEVILKNLSLTSTNSIVNGKKVGEFKGNLNFFNGFSGTYNSSVYVNDNLAGQFSIKNDGTLIMRVNYPLSGKPFVAAGIKFRDGLQAKYKTFSQNVWKMMQKIATKSSKYTRYENESIFSEVGEQFGDLAVNAVDSAQIVLTNKNGQKVLSGAAKVTKNINFKDIENDNLEPKDFIAFKVNLYNNNKVQDVIKNVGNNLEINGKVSEYPTIMLPEVVSLISKEKLKTFGEEAEKEFKQFGEQLEQGKLKISADIGGGAGAIGGVLSVGAIAGYSKAMFKYRANKTIDQVAMIVTNIRTLFAREESYAMLNNANAVEWGLVPDEMIGTKDNWEQTLHNPFSGNVVMAPSPISEDDVDNKAFKITFYGIPMDACIAVATSDWGTSSSGFLGMHIWDAENDDTTEPDYEMDNLYSGNYISGKKSFFIPNNIPPSFLDAVEACSCTDKSTCAITWKYY